MTEFRDIRPTQKIVAIPSSKHNELKKNRDAAEKHKQSKQQNKPDPDDEHKVDEFI